MNPIENVFGYWQSQILHQNPQNMEELITVCRKEWEVISLKVIRNSISRLVKIMKWVYEHGGKFYYE